MNWTADQTANLVCNYQVQTNREMEEEMCGDIMWFACDVKLASEEQPSVQFTRPVCEVSYVSLSGDQDTMSDVTEIRAHINHWSRICFSGAR